MLLKLYFPAEDSFLLAEIASRYFGEYALEIGVGSGIVLETLSKNFKHVMGSDIRIESIIHCKRNIVREVMLVCCDAASAFCNRFDLIVTNPPYLPLAVTETRDAAIDGGISGAEPTAHFIKSGLPLLNKNGRMLIVMSSLSDTVALNDLISIMNLAPRTVGSRKLFFETIYVIEVSIK
jgi:release factor glutamine methyltransferase